MKKTFLRLLFTTTLLPTLFVCSEAFSQKADTIQSPLPQMQKENLPTEKGKFLGKNAKKIQERSIKTEGNYLGLDFVRTDSFYRPNVQLTEDFGGDLLKYDPAKKKSYGASISYKYAFNFHDFFFAPGIFFDQNSFDGNGNSWNSGVALKVKNRYGAKIDIGYDINKLFAPYLTGGYAINRYTAIGDGTDPDNNVLTKSNNGYAGSGFFGAGLKVNLNKSFAINFEYTQQRFDAKAGVPIQSSDAVAKNNFATRLHIMKLGLLYNF